MYVQYTLFVAVVDCLVNGHFCVETVFTFVAQFCMNFSLWELHAQICFERKVQKELQSVIEVK